MANPVCPEHNMEARFNQAGVSKKSGKPYTAFWSCQIRGCRWTQDAAPAPQARPEPRSSPSVAPQSDLAHLRLQAASTALMAAAYGISSDAETVLERARKYYHEFLKPAFFGEVPAPKGPAPDELKQWES